MRNWNRRKRMRRPLCLFCTAFIGALVLCLLWLPPFAPDTGGVEGQQLVAEGQVYRKEYKTQQYGSGRTLVIYLKAVHIITGFGGESGQSEQVRSHLFFPKEVQNIVCYMEGGTAEPEMGTTLRVKGKLRCFSEAGNKGEFDMREYYRMMKLDFKLEDACIMARGGRADLLREGLYRLRGYFAGVLDEVFPQAEASILKAMLLGEKNGLDEEIKKLYRDSSIIHILSISGLHISMIGMGLYRLLRKLGVPLKAGALGCIGVICCYGIMTGMSLSAARAILMFILHLTADMAGRTYDMLTALALSAAALLLEQPMYVRYSGFLFSFGAVASIGLLFPALYDGKHPKAGKPLLWLRQAAACSGAVTLGTLPVHLMYYYQFPWYSYLLNLAVIPLMTVVMADGLFCMLIGGFLPVVAETAGYVDRAVLWFYEKCCLLGGKIPFGVIRSGRPENWQTACYLLLLGLFVGIVYIGRKRLPLFWKCQWILAALCLLFLRTESGLQITALDVGQGDCIHIRSGEGKHYLIDGGSSSKSGTAEYQILPYLKYEGVRKLEAVFVTHSDSDHCGAILDMLEEYPAEGISIGNLILPAISEESMDEKYMELKELAKEHKIQVQYMSRGQYMEDGGMRITCMHPYRGYDTREANEYSLVLLLEYGLFSGLFTGDVEGIGEAEAWEYMQEYLTGKALKTEKTEDAGMDRNLAGGKIQGKSDNRLTMLKVAHHGSAYSTGEELLSGLCPRLALISCGKNNQYGHPHRELLERLEEAGCRIYITAESGAVTVGSDGKRVWTDIYKN